ncbi:hypothetical protein [Candidatus Spongiihabitans sp.]|uniref:hypothetical protein n=1 Tax=Candidatus Spongiihabitans sp. TaxID=3101308 RepID=UPI003C701AA0
MPIWENEKHPDNNQEQPKLSCKQTAQRAFADLLVVEHKKIVGWCEARTPTNFAEPLASKNKGRQLFFHRKINEGNL